MILLDCDDAEAWHFGWKCIWLEPRDTAADWRPLAFPGVYLWIETEPLPTGLALYVGQTYSLQRRLAAHFRRLPAGGFNWREQTVRRPSLYVRRIDGLRERRVFEARTIERFQPRYNRLFPVAV